MGSVIVVIVNVLLKNVVEMAAAEAEEVVQTFAFDRADPCFRERIRIRRSSRRFDDAGSRAAEQLIEVVGELRVAITQQEPSMDAVVRQPHLHVASLLLHPTAVRVIGRRTDEYSAAAEMDEEQAVSRFSAERREDVLGEEVAGYERVHVQANELAPRRINRIASTARWRKQPDVVQKALDRRSPDRQVEFCQSADHSSISPVDVLLGEAKNESTTNRRDSTPADTPRFLSVSFFAQPSAIGLARNDSEDIVNVVPEFMADAKQGGPVFGAEYDVITPRLAAKDGDLEHQESYLSVTASTKALDKEVEADLN